ncbi:MAG TPA: MerR family transcriptional regulator [Ancylobacter sp.]
MSYSARYYNPSEAAKRLGVSAKALRLYEQHGLIAPVRTAAGWRTYGSAEMARAREIVALRELGLSLAQAKRALLGEPGNLDAALAAHQIALENQKRRIGSAVEKVRALREGLAAGKPNAAERVALASPADEASIALDLPWPWGGERFELFDIQPLTFIIGPLGSGKTRLAHALAAAMPNAVFIGLERLADDCAGTHALLHADPALKARVDQILDELVDAGAMASAALTALLVAMESSDAAILIVDMIEQGLEQASQQALSAYLRGRRTYKRPLFALTRSSSILDLETASPDTAIILCPANHSSPSLVAPYRGAPGYEAVATCLASPDVRARTEGLVAWRPQMA